MRRGVRTEGTEEIRPRGSYERRRRRIQEQEQEKTNDDDDHDDRDDDDVDDDGDDQEAMKDGREPCRERSVALAPAYSWRPMASARLARLFSPLDACAPRPIFLSSVFPRTDAPVPLSFRTRYRSTVPFFSLSSSRRYGYRSPPRHSVAPCLLDLPPLFSALSDFLLLFLFFFLPF